MTDPVHELASILARLGGLALLYVPGVAICYWLYPSRGLDRLERAYLAALGSLCLLTFIGMTLLEVEGHLDWRAAAYWSVACGVACAVVRAAGMSLARLAAGARRASEAGRWGENARGTIRVRGTRERVPVRFGPRYYLTGTPSRKAQWASKRKTGRPSEVSARWRRRALPSSVLLSVVVLTLIAYRGFGRRTLESGGPVAAFSVPVASLEAVQAMVKQGGNAAIPFVVENLGGGENAYRVEAWTGARLGVTSYFTVAAGATHRGQLEVLLPGAADAGSVDLYLYPGEGIVPVAHLRLWAQGDE